MVQGLVTNNGFHILSDVACSVFDMVNIKWSVDDYTVDTVEAVNLGAKGAYASLWDFGYHIAPTQSRASVDQF